jgi:hypothetical protein
LEDNKIPITDICALAIYELINVVFVYKYTSRITLHPWATSLLYLVMVNIFILLLFKKYEFRLSLKMQNVIYFSTIALLAILLSFLMLHFDPQKIRVGRYPAMHDWITRFLNSEFPYTSPIKPSGFPFLFVIAMPFYFLGDLGFFQIFSFLTFAVLVHLRHRQNKINRFRLIFLLITAPIFLYEIVVRSDLFSNMVMVILYLAILEILAQKRSRVELIILGIIGGLLLSTRGIVLLIYIPIFGYFLSARGGSLPAGRRGAFGGRRKIIKDGLFFISMFVGFLLTFVPFLIWDWAYFIKFGPFSIQLAHIPNWLLILSMASSIYCVLTIKSLKRIYSSISFILFGVAGLAFATMVFDCGWHKTLLGDGFDIGYFCFTLPFLLISLDFPEKEIPSSHSGVFISGQI